MPRHHRQERVNSLIQEEIADIIRGELKDPRLGFASVVSADVAPDLRHARVMVSVLGSAQEKQATLEALNHAAAFIREQLRRRLEIRRIPQIDFRLDENIEYSIHIAEVLDKLKTGGGGSGA